jgi:hypothetical protein
MANCGILITLLKEEIYNNASIHLKRKVDKYLREN